MWSCWVYIIMLFASWEVRIVKNCDRGLENVAWDLRQHFQVWSLKFYYINNFCQSSVLKSLEIRLFYRKLKSKKRGNLLSVFHRKSPKYSNDQKGKFDWNWLEFYSERNTGLRAITAPSYKQPSKLSILQNTQLNLLTVTEINLCWLIVDGCVKKAKDWRLPLTFVGRIVKSWTSHVRVISQSNSRI